MNTKVHQYLSFLQKILLLLVFLLEVGCNTDPPFPRCFSADNFGFETIMAPAYYSKDQVNSFESIDGENTATFSPNQVVRWRDTDLVTTGEPIKVKTNGMWTAWAKSNKKYTPATGVVELSDTENKIVNQSIIPLDRTCWPYSMKDSTISGCSDNKCQYIDENLKSDTKTGAYGAPCWFKNGYGAYLLFKRDGDPDPNQTVNIMRAPQSPVVHLGYKSADEGGSGAFSSIEHPIKDSSCQDIKLEPGWKIYVKILDRYYWDNAGGYVFEFISGTKRENGIMIFETIRKEVKEILITQGGEAIFKRITQNDSFRNLVHSLLVLFLMISALLYIFGMVQHPMPDFIARILKISLVLMLISPNSWQFFYDNLLSLFINGTDTIIGMINGHSGMDHYNREAPFAFLDYMIRDKIFSPIVWNIKMRALIISEFTGIFGVLFICIAVLIYVCLCVYAFAIYLAGLIGIALLIALMPIFFVGILFSKLKSLFDGWLTQCISFSLQSIMILTLLSLFGSLIMNTYYRLLGFTACYNKWMEVKLCVGSACLIDSSFFAWTPGQTYVPKVINVLGKSNVCDSLNCSYDSIPRFTFTGGGAVIPVPPEYTEKDFRYVDYPYFDPDNTGSKNPDGISVRKNSRFTDLANLLNSLMALPAINGNAIARLVEDIKNEIKKLNLGNTQLRQIEYSKNTNIPNNYRQLQEDVKSALISLIGLDVVNPTSKQDLDRQYDYSIIKQIRKGYLIIWPELLVLLLLAFLIYLMRSFVTNIGSSLGGGSVMSTMLSGVWDRRVAQLTALSQSLLSGGLTTIVSTLAKKHVEISSTAIGGGLEKTGSAVMNTVKRVPILGTAVKFTSEVTKAITMPDSAEFKLQKKFDKQLKRLTYARAVIGSHLSYAGLDMLKYFGKDTVDRILGRKETGEWEDIKLQHAFFMEKLRYKILGPEKPKKSTYLPSEEDESPFPKSKSIDDALVSREGDVGSNAVDLVRTDARDIDRQRQLEEEGDIQDDSTSQPDQGRAELQSRSAGEEVSSDDDDDSQSSQKGQPRRDEALTQHETDNTSSAQLYKEDHPEIATREEIRSMDDQTDIDQNQYLERAKELNEPTQREQHLSEDIKLNIMSESNLEQEENRQIEDISRDYDQLAKNISLQDSEQDSDLQQSGPITSDNNTEAKPEQLQETLHSDNSQELESNVASNKTKSSSSPKKKLEQVQEEQKKRKEIEVLQEKIEQVKEQQKSDKDQSSDDHE